MNAKIDQTGYLYVERRGKWRDQYCPWRSDNVETFFCGDWCPMFDEHIVGAVFVGCAGHNMIPYKVVVDEREDSNHG